MKDKKLKINNNWFNKFNKGISLKNKIQTLGIILCNKIESNSIYFNYQFNSKNELRDIK
jgi:hypothetical protein